MEPALHGPLLGDLLCAIVLSLVVVAVFASLNVPVVVGFIAAGILAGPGGLRLVEDPRSVAALADFGVVLLLFSIGLETSVGALLGAGRVGVGALAQVVLTAAAGALAARAMGLGAGASIVVGMAISVSSTAVVMRALMDRGEVESPHGRRAMQVLILQDILVIPMTLAIPWLAGEEAVGHAAFARLLWAAAALVALVGGARLLATPVLAAIARTRSRELFVLAVMAMGLGSAWVGTRAGLSPPMGAFLTGMVIGASDYAHHALSLVLPFRDAFLPLFFIAVGMLVEPGVLFAHAGALAAGLAALVVAKALLAWIALAAVGEPRRPSFIAALGLAQVGEFSFVLLRLARAHGLLSGEPSQTLLGLCVASLAITPILVRIAPRLAGALPDQGPEGASAAGSAALLTDAAARAAAPVSGHVIIVGFGINGRGVARVLRHVGVPYEVLELNDETVGRYRALGEPIHLGDGTSRQMLDHLHLATAREVIVSITDPASTERIVRLVREAAPHVALVVRTRFLAELEPLLALGAGVVVADEIESSLRLVSDCLRRYGVPSEDAATIVESLARTHYKPLLAEPSAWRVPALDDLPLRPLRLAVATGAPSCGRSLAELDLRRRTALTCVAVERAGEVHANPPADFRLEPGDVLVLLGSADDLERARELFLASPMAPPASAASEGRR